MRMNDRDELWQAVLSDIELRVSRPNFLTWLKNSRLIDNQDGVALVALPNNFAKEWVEVKYNKLILGSMRTLSGSVKKVEYVVEGTLSKKPARRIQKQVAPMQVDGQLAFQELRVDPKTNLNPRYTLNSLIVGPFNELAFSAASAVIENVGVKYNPLFVYGGTGLGKTHLIQAVGNEILSAYKNSVAVKYVTSEKFTNDVVWAIRNGRAEEIKKAYRDVDVLIIDDIHFIGGKEKTEEEFFHTFNALHENSKQIIISSDRPPRAIPTLEERLRSRFEGGMIVDISHPEYESRVAIIKSKLQEHGVEFEDQAVDVIAKRVQKNIREIEGILNKLLFYQTTYKKQLDAAAVDRIITEASQQSVNKISPSQIIKAVSGFFEVSSNDLMGRARNKEFVEPRQIAMFLFRDMLNMSYPDIASRIGKRDHTTAIYAYKKVSDGIKESPDLSQKIMMIRDAVNKVE